MPDEAERFSVSSAAAASSSSSFPRFEGHAATNSEATGGDGGSGGSGGREKRDATGEGDQGECRLMIPFLVLRGCEVGT